jgi:hypothetical protein
MKCGRCAPLVGPGEVCVSATVAAACAPDSICLIDKSSDAAQPQYRCTPVQRAALGASCDGQTVSCALGLYCAAQTLQCEPLASSGAPCGEGNQGFGGGCAAPLVCGRSNNAWTTCGPSGLGDVTFVGAHEKCDGATVRCLVGQCPSGFGGDTCPAIIADGQPCAAGQSCDAFSDCFDLNSTADAGFVSQGTCVLHDTMTCH